MTKSTVSNDKFVIERTYNIPVAQVYQAWADPRLKARWFAGSIEALGDTYTLDFRVGGHETNRGGPPGGPIYAYDSEFRDIVTEQRIIYTYEMFAEDDRISVSVATVEFHAEGASTRLVLTEQSVFLDGLDNSGQREGGTKHLLDSLASFLETDAT